MAVSDSLMADCHMHTPRCNHAEGSVVDYARAAVAAGLDEIGISDHSPMPAEWDDGWRMRADELDGYVAEVLAIRDQFSDRLTVRLGLEVDWRPGCEEYVRQLSERYPWDYLIGSVHYLGDWAFDDPDERGRWSVVGVGATYCQYFEQVAASASSGLFDIIGHPDLAKKFAHRPAEDEVEEVLAAESSMLDAVAAAGVALEVSSAGLRKPCAEIYPASRIVAAAAQRDIPFSYGSDAHAPDLVGYGLQECRQLLVDCGVGAISSFCQRQRSSSVLA
ncbi:MAG: histidinol-phosphatase HisJ family protein [Mariprofundales bacterium]|nr:histidinol-phosphatase HisJ family protein [Mariprofundales bacterium]